LGPRLFVGNLPFDTDQASLRALFEGTGKEVAEVAIITDRATGRSRGFGFVVMASEDDAREAAAALNGAEFGNRNLVVNMAQPRAPRPIAPRGDWSNDGGHGFGGGDRRPFPKAGGSRRKRRHKRIL